MVARTSNGVNPQSGVECRKAGANRIAHAESWRRADTQGSERKLMTTATQQERGAGLRQDNADQSTARTLLK